MPMMKSARMGMAMERVMIVQSWPHVGDALDGFMGLMLLPLAGRGGSPCIPTMFFGFRLAFCKTRKGYESKARLH